MTEIKKCENFDPNPENHERLENPIKIQWQPGKMRSRIAERLGDYSNWNRNSEDPSEWSLNLEDNGRPAVAFRTLDRQKTNIVIKTVEEAVSLYNELDWYSDGAGYHGITWMNGPMEKSIKRIRKSIWDELEERGYTVEPSDNFTGKVYVNEVEGTKK